MLPTAVALMISGLLLCYLQIVFIDFLLIFYSFLVRFNRFHSPACLHLVSQILDGRLQSFIPVRQPVYRFLYFLGVSTYSKQGVEASE